MSDPAASPGPVNRAESGLEEEAPKVASSPIRGPGLLTPVVALEPQPYDQKAFRVVAPLVAE